VPFDLLPTDLNQLQAFLLVFVRMGSLFAFLPVFGGTAPRQVKAALALTSTAAIFPIVDTSHVTVDVDVLTMVVMIVGEALIGVMTAFIVNLVFAGIQTAGYIIGFQIGFGIVNVVDPASGAQVSISAQFLNILAMLLFLTLNVHHALILGFVEGFKMVPLTTFAPHPSLETFFVDAFGGMLLTAAQLSAPITVSLLLKQAAMGILARTVPQMNIFVVGFPVTIALGLFTLAFLMEAYGAVTERLFMATLGQVGVLLSALN
jgi:flagellar biosynthetic protein FliR